jgi:hypothetical protein
MIFTDLCLQVVRDVNGMNIIRSYLNSIRLRKLRSNPYPSPGIQYLIHI